MRANPTILAMTNKAFFCNIASVLLLLCTPNSLLKAEPVQDLINSVVLLRGEANFPCATGFILDNGDILTNAHVTRSICPLGRCNDIQAFRAKDMGAEATEKLPIKLEIKKEIVSFDVAKLEQLGENKILGNFKTDFPSLKLKSAVASLGFPRCGKLAFSKGEITDLGPIQFYTTIDGSHGSSGSPIFDEQNKLVGIVDQSTSLTGALASLGWGAHFPLRAVGIANAYSIINDVDEVSFKQEAALLKNHLLTHVSKLAGNDRLKEDLLVSNMVEGFRRRVIDSNLPAELKIYTLHFGEYPGEFLRATTPTLGSNYQQLLATVEELMLAYNVEVKGAASSIFAPLDLSKFEAGLRDSGRTPERTRQLMTIMLQGIDDLGMETRFAVRTAAYLLLFILIGSLITFSSGYMYALMQGSRFRRIIITSLASLLWPFSFIWFLWRRRSGRKSA